MDIGPWEIVALLVIAMLMFGPERLPGLARKAGRVVRYLGGIANDARGQLQAELGPEWGNIQISDLNPRTFVQRHLLDSDEVAAVRGALNETQSAIGESSQALSESTEALKEAGKDFAEATASSSPMAAVSGTSTGTAKFDPEAT